MLAYNELKQGLYIVVDGDPWVIQDFAFLRMQQRKPVSKVKMRNLITGKVQERTFHQSDKLEEVELGKIRSCFLYETKGAYWFNEAGNPKNRFSFTKEQIGDKAIFLKPNLEAIAYKFNDRIVSVELPVKVDYKVMEAPPAVRGDTAQGGSKSVVIEGGASVSVPLFINEGDIIRVNTDTGIYDGRV